MLPSEFPPEILTIISTLITTKDKLQCTIVCKNWMNSFQMALWNSLKINQDKLENIVDAFDNSQSIYSKNGHRVREITWSKTLEISNEHLYKLQHCFQNLQKLDMQMGTVSKYDFGGMADWNLWNRLTCLVIYKPKYDSTCENVLLLKILHCLPNLTFLNVLDRRIVPLVPNTWEMLETLHEYLPRLKHLELNFYLDGVDFKDMESIMNVRPAKSITTVKFQSHYLDFGWIVYLALKYPNLSILESKKCFRKIVNKQSIPEEAIAVLSRLKGCFKSLKSAKLKQNFTLGPYHQILWNVLQPLAGSIESLNLVLMSNCRTNDGPIELSSNSFELNSGSLEKLILNIRLPETIVYQAPISFGMCSRLNILDLDISQGVFELDAVLTGCISLKILRLRAKSITLTLHVSHTPDFHALEKIIIVHSTIGSEVLEHLSFSCRKLTKMFLMNTVISATISELENHLNINMSFTNFEELSMHDVRFHAQIRESDRVGYLKVSSTSIFVIEQTHPEKDPKNQESDHLQSIDDKQTRFYRHRTMYENKKMRILKSPEIRLVQDFLKDSSISEKTLTVYEDKFLTDFSKNSLDSYNPNLYTKLQCRHVQVYSIHADEQE